MKRRIPKASSDDNMINHEVYLRAFMGFCPQEIEEKRKLYEILGGSNPALQEDYDKSLETFAIFNVRLDMDFWDVYAKSASEFLSSAPIDFEKCIVLDDMTILDSGSTVVPLIIGFRTLVVEKGNIEAHFRVHYEQKYDHLDVVNHFLKRYTVVLNGDCDMDDSKIKDVEFSRLSLFGLVYDGSKVDVNKKWIMMKKV